jgi:tripartite-type tricarboxylate transporter receptor subunit TctC
MASAAKQEGAMKLARRKFLSLAAGAAALPAVSRVATAQSYPTRPITMIVPSAAGNLTDVRGRILAERMGAALGQPVVIENVAGAEGSIAAGRAARARADGYTIFNGNTGTHVLNGALYSLRYDLLNDFAPIAAVATAPIVLFARKTLPARDLKELIGWLKANPNKVSAAVAIGGTHLVTALFRKETETRFALVPYRGSEMQDLVAGQVDLLFDTLVALPLVRAGSIKAYALTSDSRVTLAPDIPTFSEMGLPALSYSAWGGLFAPKGTPKEIIGKLNAAVVETLADPAVRSRIAGLGMEVFPRELQTPEALAGMQKADIEKWWPVMKEFGIKAE